MTTQEPRRGRLESLLCPLGASWMDLMPEHGTPATRFVLACLDYGVIEAWQDQEGVVRLYLVPECGGDLVIPGAGDEGASCLDLERSSPGSDDPDSLVVRSGAAWITLLPGLQRLRTRAQGQPSRTRRVQPRRRSMP